MKKLFQNYVDTFRGLSQEVWWLALITFVNRAGTMVIPFLSLYLTTDLDFSLSQVGWIMSAFGMGSVLGAWLGGRFTDAIGHYKVMIFSLVGSGLLFIAFSFLYSFASICVGIFIIMMVADMFRPAAYVALGAFSKPENKTRSVTLYRLAINLGFSAGPTVGGIIITSIGYGGLFYVDGITCILAGLLLLKVLGPKRAKDLGNVRNKRPKSPYTDHLYLVFIAGMILFEITFLQYFSSMPVFYKEGHQINEFYIGLILGLNGLLIFVFEMPLVKWLENSGFNKLSLISCGAVFMGLSFIILNLTSWVGVVVIGMILMTFGEMIALPFAYTFAMDRAKRGNQGEYIALLSMGFSVAHIIGHNMGMQLVSGVGYDNTWMIMTILAIVCIAMISFAKRFINREMIAWAIPKTVSVNEEEETPIKEPENILDE